MPKTVTELKYISYRVYLFTFDMCRYFAKNWTKLYVLHNVSNSEVLLLYWRCILKCPQAWQCIYEVEMSENTLSDLPVNALKACYRYVVKFAHWPPEVVLCLYNIVHGELGTVEKVGYTKLPEVQCFPMSDLAFSNPRSFNFHMEGIRIYLR